MCALSAVVSSDLNFAPLLLCSFVPLFLCSFVFFEVTMAHYQNLPVFKSALRLQVYLENAVKGFSRYHKYTIGARLRETG